VNIPSETAFGEPLLSADDLARALGMTRRWVYAQVRRTDFRLTSSDARLPSSSRRCVPGWLSGGSASGPRKGWAPEEKRQATPQRPPGSG
jgi:hypothetical protein